MKSEGRDRGRGRGRKVKAKGNGKMRKKKQKKREREGGLRNETEAAQNTKHNKDYYSVQEGYAIQM